MPTEYNVDYIWESLSDFWRLFEDAPVIEQLWRGYAFVVNNLYYQLYQLDLSKCINTVPYNWVSDWEVFVFDKSTATTLLQQGKFKQNSTLVDVLAISGALPAAVDDYVDLGMLTSPNGDHEILFDVDVGGGVNITKSFYINVYRGQADDGWHPVEHLTQKNYVPSPAFLNDYSLDVHSSNNSLFLRLRKTVGTESGDASIVLTNLAEGTEVYSGDAYLGSPLPMSVTFEKGYPYGYTMPFGVKNVRKLRESPREVVNLPPYTVLQVDGLLRLPSGFVRHPDKMYIPDDIIIAPNSELLFVGGISVDTEKLLPVENYIVDEDAGTIHFKSEPYSRMWSNVVIRDLEMIYDNFGSLLQYYKKDSYKYLREVQGLWYAYWNGASISNIQSGVNILKDMPFALETGFVDDIQYFNDTITIGPFEYVVSSDQLASIRVGDAITYVNPLENIIGIRPGKPATVLSGDLSLISLGSRIDEIDVDNDTVLIDGVTFQLADGEAAKFFETEPITFIQNDTLAHKFWTDSEKYFRIISGDIGVLSVGNIVSDKQTNSATVTIGETIYNIGQNQVLNVTKGEFVEQFTPLTKAIGVFDYINYPGWWKKYVGWIDETTFTCFFDGTGYFDTSKFDIGNFDDTFSMECLESIFIQYFTFLVEINQENWFRNRNEMELVRAFLFAIKPAYTHFIFDGELGFGEEVIVFDGGYSLQWGFVPTDIPLDFHIFDMQAIHPTFDDGAFFDFEEERIRDDLRIYMFGAPEIFNDDNVRGYTWDDEAVPLFDYVPVGFDSDPYNDTMSIEWTRSVPSTLVLEDSVNPTDSTTIS